MCHYRSINYLCRTLGCQNAAKGPAERLETPCEKREKTGKDCGVKEWLDEEATNVDFKCKECKKKGGIGGCLLDELL